MIRWLEAPETEIRNFPVQDAFYTRIAGQAQAYAGQASAQFWRQDNTALLAKVGGNMTLCAAKNADWSELRAFFDMIGAQTITLNLAHCMPLQLVPHKQGAIQQFVHTAVKPVTIVAVPQEDLRPVYGLLQQSGFSGLGSYPDWLADMTLRMHAGVTQAFAVYEGGQLLACASILFQTQAQVFLGAIATQAVCRGQGIGGGLVTALSQQCAAKGERVNLFCADGGIQTFYQKIGFRQIGRWAESEAKYR